MSYRLKPDERDALETLWWIFGNSGRKCTLQNHKLIQGFLHYNEDRREIYVEANSNILENVGQERFDKVKLTDDCLECVNLVLDGEIEKAIKLAKK